MAKDIKINVKTDGLDDVSDGIDEVVDSVDNLNDSLDDTNEKVDDLGDGLGNVGKSAEKGLGGVAKGFKGVGLAIKAAGIGLVIAAFAALKQILEQQQPVLDFIDTAFTSIGLAVSAVTDALGEAFSASSDATGGFDAMKKVIGGLMTIAITPLKVSFYAIKAAVVGAQLAWEQSFFGDKDQAKITELKASLAEIKGDLVEVGEDALQAGKDIANNISEAIDEVVTVATIASDALSAIDGEAIINQAKRTTELKKQAQISAAINAGLLEQFDRIAEQQRQIRDNELVSINDRIAANEALGETLEEQEALMLKGVNISIQAARLQLAANNTTENRVALIEAQNEKLAVLAAIEGKRSEQIVNSVALQKEANEINQTGIDGTIERARVERDFAAEQIENERLKIEQKQANLEIEKQLELDRIQAIIDNAPLETQARIDAEQLFLDAELDFKLKEQELAIKHEEELVKINKKGEDARTKQRAKGIQNTVDGINSVSALTSDVFAISNNLGKQDEKSKEARAKKQFNVQKALNLSLAGIDAFKAITASLAQAPVAIGPIPNPAGIASLAFAAVTSAANIAKIATSKYKSTGGGGGASASVPSVSVPSANIPSGGASAPELTNDTLFSSQSTAGEDVGFVGTGAGSNQQPIKAYVVETEITETQGTVNSFEQRSEIG